MFSVFSLHAKGLYMYLSQALESSKLEEKNRNVVLVEDPCMRNFLAPCFRWVDPGTKDKPEKKWRRVVQRLITAINADNFLDFLTES